MCSHDAFDPEFDEDAVEIDHRVERIERALLPQFDLGQNGVGDFANQRGADLDLVELFEFGLNVPRAQASRVERQDTLIESSQSALMFLDELRLKVPLTIPWYVEGNLAQLALERLFA